MPVPMRATVVLAGLTLLATAAGARGSLVVIPFAGPIVSVSNEPGPLPGFAVGEPVSGQLSYDPAAVTAVLPQDRPGIVSYHLPVDLQVIVSGVTRFSGSLATGAEIRNLGQPGGDALSFQDAGSAPSFLLMLIDRTGTALSSTTLPATLDLSAFPVRSFGYAERIDGQGRSFRLDFGPEPLGTPSVPEPPTGVLALTGLAVAGGWAAGRRARRDRSHP
jgi:hypothetical protein